MAPVTALDRNNWLDKEDKLIQEDTAQDSKVASTKSNETEFWLKSCRITLENIRVKGKNRSGRKGRIAQCVEGKRKITLHTELISCTCCKPD